MGIQTSVITFTGRVGNLIAYKRGDKHCLRSMPETVRQTANTRRAAKWFGAASRKGAFIRNAVAPDIDIFCDSQVVNRLNRTIVTAGRNNHAALQGFRFNGHAGIEKFFGQLPVFTKDGQLHIAAQKLLCHGNAVRMEIKLLATRIDFTTRTVTGTDADLLHIDLEEPFPGADLTVDVPGKGTLLVILQVRIFLKDGISYDRKYNAADIIAVIGDQPQEKPHQKSRPRKKLLILPPEPVRNTAPGKEAKDHIPRE
ncbi:hypothetical protein [Chitinophaga deserti]|uniref:hypothetical protein n=1 Tax=Chitinophaga deserti TaxID=2164099 RepID=UPI00130099B3|nr:hypothetical protein [Chitinophaga deserti]